MFNFSPMVKTKQRQVSFSNLVSLEFTHCTEHRMVVNMRSAIAKFRWLAFTKYISARYHISEILQQLNSNDNIASQYEFRFTIIALNHFTNFRIKKCGSNSKTIAIIT